MTKRIGRVIGVGYHAMTDVARALEQPSVATWDEIAVVVVGLGHF